MHIIGLVINMILIFYQQPLNNPSAWGEIKMGTKISWGKC